SLKFTLIPVCCSISLSSGTFHTVTPIVNIKTALQITANTKIPIDSLPLPNISQSLCIINKPNVPKVNASKVTINLCITYITSRYLELCVKLDNQYQYYISIIV